MVPLTDRDWEVFSTRLEQVDFPKKTLLLKAGQTEHYLSFLEKGVIRYYFPDIDRELTFDFGFEGEFASGYDSFLTRQPSMYQIETLVPSVLWRISYEGLQEVYRHTRVGNSIGRLAAEGLYLKKSRREKSLLRDTAEERYLKLFKEQPQLIRSIPLKYIAAYIGITPQALSRIRGRIS